MQNGKLCDDEVGEPLHSFFGLQSQLLLSLLDLLVYRCDPFLDYVQQRFVHDPFHLELETTVNHIFNQHIHKILSLNALVLIELFQSLEHYRLELAASACLLINR